MYVYMVSLTDTGNRTADIMPILYKCGALLYVSERNLVAEWNRIHGLDGNGFIGLHDPARQRLSRLHVFDHDNPHRIGLIVDKEMSSHGTSCSCREKDIIIQMAIVTPLDTAAPEQSMMTPRPFWLRVLALVGVLCCSNTWAGPLHDAAEQGDIGQVKRLIDQGADVNARDDYDLTPLHFSVGAGHTEIVELLIAEGANVNARHQMGTPLHPAALFGHKAIAKLLIAAGADVNALSADGVTPLHFAAGKGHVNLAELLIASGAVVNVTDKDGATPLHAAVLNGYRTLTELLIAHGADVNARTKAGLTPLRAATLEDHRDIVELLKRHGALLELSI